jgi:hypothetical protein
LEISATAVTEDHKVAASATDTTPDYLSPKLAAGAGITLAVLNPGANEQVQITAAAVSEDHKVSASAADTTPDYLSPKLVAGAGITLAILGGGGNEQVEITGTGVLGVTATLPILASAGVNPDISVGLGCTSSANQAFACGLNNLAYGDQAAACGSTNVARGAWSHVEGNLCEANGDGAHAEGAICVAQSARAHAEGGDNVASAEDAHAEGNENRVGDVPADFSVAAGGVTVTIVGDVRQFFVQAHRVTVWSTVPGGLPSVVRTVATLPAFGGVNTTFDLSAAIDVVTTAGKIVDAQRGFAGHVEGWQNIVVCGTADHSGGHAEGALTRVYGPYGHAEGGGPIVYGDSGHAEGEFTTAGGTDCHAEGGTSSAYGFCAHAEGGAGASLPTRSNGGGSHTEGRDTLCGYDVRTFTIAAGGTVITIAGDVTAEYSNGDQITCVPLTPNPGRNVNPIISSAPAFGGVNTTLSISTTLALATPVSDGAFRALITGGVCVSFQKALGAHAEGNGTIARGDGAHAEGLQTQATANQAHAEGSGTIASALNAHSEGLNTIASGQRGHAEGGGTTASGTDSHAEGTTTVASAASSHAEGDRCQATTNIGAHAEGQLSVATGLGAHAEGGGTLASGQYSHAEGLSGIASGTRSHAEGVSTLASGSHSHVEGELSVASGYDAHAEGFTCTSSGTASHAQGLTCTASATGSHAQGTDANALREGDFAISNVKFAALGDNQTRFSQCKGLTAGLGAGESVTLKPGSSTNNFLELSKAYTVTVVGCATVMGLGAAARQTWNFVLVFGASRRSGGAIDVTAVTSLVSIVTGAGFVGATLVPTDGGGGGLSLTFTINGGLTVASRITAKVEYVEVLGT